MPANRRKELTDMELKEQGRYGKPDSEVFGKCEVCGRPIAIGLARCMRCKGSTRLIRKEQPGRSRALGFGLLLLMLLIALGAWGYRWLTERRSGADAPHAGESISEQADDGSHSRRSDPAQREGDPSAPRVQHDQRARQVPALPPNQTSIRSVPRLMTETIVCPACAGNGRLPYPAPRTGTYTCPVCTGAGNRTRRFLNDTWKLCGACKGMGAAAKEDDRFRTKNRIVKETCQTCAGKGLVAVE